MFFTNPARWVLALRPAGNPAASHQKPASGKKLPLRFLKLRCDNICSFTALPAAILFCLPYLFASVLNLPASSTCSCVLVLFGLFIHEVLCFRNCTAWHWHCHLLEFVLPSITSLVLQSLHLLVSLFPLDSLLLSAFNTPAFFPTSAANKGSFGSSYFSSPAQAVLLRDSIHLLRTHYSSVKCPSYNVSYLCSLLKDKINNQKALPCRSAGCWVYHC